MNMNYRVHATRLGCVSSEVLLLLLLLLLVSEDVVSVLDRHPRHRTEDDEEVVEQTHDAEQRLWQQVQGQQDVDQTHRDEHHAAQSETANHYN